MKESENKIVIIGFRLDRNLYYKIMNQMTKGETLSSFIRKSLLENISKQSNTENISK